MSPATQYPNNFAYTDIDEATAHVGANHDQAHFRLGRELYLNKQTARARPSGTVLDTVDISTAFTVEGTPTNTDDVYGSWVRFTTSTTINTDGGLLAGAFNIFSRGSWQTDFTARIKLGATLTTARYWIGLVNADPMGLTTANLNTFSLAAFRYDTGVDTTTAYWRCVTNDAGNDNGTVTALTSAMADNMGAIVASQIYDLRVRLVANQGGGPNKAIFMVNNRVVANHVANLPAAATYLAPHLQVRCLAGSAARVVDVNSVQVYSQLVP